MDFGILTVFWYFGPLQFQSDSNAPKKGPGGPFLIKQILWFQGFPIPSDRVVDQLTNALTSWSGEFRHSRAFLRTITAEQGLPKTYSNVTVDSKSFSNAIRRELLRGKVFKRRKKTCGAGAVREWLENDLSSYEKAVQENGATKKECARFYSKKRWL